MDFSATGPVAATIALVQVIKIVDKNDKFSAHYSLIAMLCGVAVGALLSGGKDWQSILSDAIMNAAYSSLAWQAKKALMDPTGAKLPGDPT